MTASTKFLTPGGGGVILTPASSIAADVTLSLPAKTGTIMNSGNMPAFSAYQSSAQTLSTNTDTKILLQAEEYDTADCFSSSRFTPNVAGYYQVNAAFRISSSATGLRPQIWKNGSKYKVANDVASSSSAGISTLIYLNGTTDYVEFYALIGSGQALSANSQDTWFNGALVRAA